MLCTNFVDCCKQTLTWLWRPPTHPPTQPPIHPPIQCHTFLRKKGATGNLLHRFAPILCKAQDRRGPNAQNFQLQTLQRNSNAQNFQIQALQFYYEFFPTF